MTSISDGCHKPLKQLAGEFSKAESAQVCSRGVSNDPDALNLMGVVRAEEHKALEAEFISEGSCFLANPSRRAYQSCKVAAID